MQTPPKMAEITRRHQRELAQAKRQNPDNVPALKERHKAEVLEFYRNRKQ